MSCVRGWKCGIRDPDLLRDGVGDVLPCWWWGLRVPAVAEAGAGEWVTTLLVAPV